MDALLYHQRLTTQFSIGHWNENTWMAIDVFRANKFTKKRLIL